MYFGLLKTINFYLNESPYYFTGTISTNQTVVYSSSQPITLVVTATDHGTPPLLTVVPVVIRVMDINNNAPEFAPIVDRLVYCILVFI
jgi:hypothetical protein